MLGVCLPSRGLVFSRTMQCVIEGMQALSSVGIASKYFTSHNLPIPQCHIFCVESALSNPAINKILIVEEDMYADPDTFVAVATSDHPITVVNYNDRNGMSHGIMHIDENGKILWSGLGFIAIKREVFNGIGKPYFRIDHRYKNKKRHTVDGKSVTEFEEIEPRRKYNEKTLQFEEIKDPYIYGGLDVDFYTRAKSAGFEAICLENYKASQFELVSLGEKYNNNGCHTIKQV